MQADAIVFRHDSSLWITELSGNLICLGAIRGLLDPAGKFADLKPNEVALAHTHFLGRLSVQLAQVCKFAVEQHGVAVPVLKMLQSQKDLDVLQEMIAAAISLP